MEKSISGLLTGKVVIVSGGPGLGIKAARAIAREGAKVVCIARTVSYVEEVVAEILASGGQAVAAPADISSREDCDRVARIVEETCGRLDGMVNSAYTAGDLSTFAEADLENWRMVMGVNFFGTLSLIQANLPLLERDGGAAIINVNTTSSIRPMRRQGAYGSSKVALEFASRLLAVELGDRNIRVNTMYCGPMKGPSLDKAMASWARAKAISIEEVTAQTASVMALGRIPGDEEAAEVLVTLLSDYCSVLTGTAINASGGAFIDQRI